MKSNQIFDFIALMIFHAELVEAYFFGAFFLLEQKEPKIQESRIPQPGGLQASTRLDGYRPDDDLPNFNFYINDLNFKKNAYALCTAVCKVATQERWAERKSGGDSSVLDFLVLFDQAKRTKRRAESPIE